MYHPFFLFGQDFTIRTRIGLVNLVVRIVKLFLLQRKLLIELSFYSKIEL